MWNDTPAPQTSREWKLWNSGVEHGKAEARLQDKTDRVLHAAQLRDRGALTNQELINRVADILGGD